MMADAKAIITLRGYGDVNPPMLPANIRRRPQTRRTASG